jgi:hypothetical protein
VNDITQGNLEGMFGSRERKLYVEEMNESPYNVAVKSTRRSGVRQHLVGRGNEVGLLVKIICWVVNSLFIYKLQCSHHYHKLMCGCAQSVLCHYNRRNIVQ